MHWILIGAIVVACAACQTQPDGTQPAGLPSQPQPAQAACHGFAAPVTAAGKPEQATGQACEQPDGSWRVVQNTPGLPAQSYAAGPPAAAAGASPSRAAQTSCSSYAAPVTVGGETRQATIEACPQPDGSWTITQNTPGLPTQVYQVPPPSSYPYPYADDYTDPDFLPYWAGSPWFFGLAPSIVVVQHFHHVHHGLDRAFGHGAVRGFGAGSGHGFGAGLGHGFAAGGGGRH